MKGSENDSFAKTCTEVTKFLETIPPNKIQKIPKNVILYYKENMDINYKFEIDKTKNMYEQNFTKKAAIIIITIYKKYLANEEEKIKLNEILKKNFIISEEKKEKQYMNNKFPKKDFAVGKSKELIVKKESFIKKIWNYIKKQLF